MRDIKFRAYIKDKEKALLKYSKEYLDKNNWVIPVTGMAFDRLNINGNEYNNVGLRAENGRDVMFKESELELMQYTGLKDREGFKEIYEGDIISTAYHTLDESGKEITERIVCEVFYCEDSLAFVVNPPDGRLVEINDPEVLGNIHENKDLLNGS